MNSIEFPKWAKRVAILVGSVSVTTACCIPDSISEPPRCAVVGEPNSTLVAPASCELHLQTNQVCTYDEYGRIKSFTLEQDHQCFCGHI